MMRKRLRRLEEPFYRSPIYFVTASTHERKKILNNSALHERLISFGKEGEQHGAWLGAYILMPDHLHAFVVVDDERMSVSQWMKSLKNALSSVLRANGIAAPHWQKGFFDHMLRSTDSYSAKWEYVRENAVRAELVNSWRDWPFVGEVFDLEFRRD
jgi:putative transposase